MPRLAISLRPTSAPHLYCGDPRRTIATVSRLGYDGVDVAVSNPNDVERLAELVEGSGLTVGALMTGPLWSSERLSLSDPATTATACRRISEITVQAKELSAAVVVGSALGWMPVEPRLRGRFRTTMLDALRQLAAHAERLQVPLLIEPLNRYESNAVLTAAEAAELARLIEAPVSLVLDCFHANIEEADVCEAAGIVAPNVGLVQLSDSNRRMPGDGHFPIDAWVRALREGGYRGEFTIEAEFGSDPEAEARRALEFCRARGL